MSVGLPGTGVGGLFYLVSALCMPFQEAYRVAAGRSNRRSRGVVVRQTLIALGVLGGIWVTGWMIGLMLVRVPAIAVALNAAPALTERPSNILQAATFYLAFATLGMVLGAVEIAGTVRRWKARRRVAPTPTDPARLTRNAA